MNRWSGKCTKKKTGNTVWGTGLIIHPYAPHLGASPDGLVFDKKHGYGLLEIKCPGGKKTTTLQVALASKNFILCKDSKNEVQVKKNHAFFYQIQGQLLVSGMLWCDLVIYFKTNELFLKRIAIDQEFCEKMYTELTDLFNKYVLKQ